MAVLLSNNATSTLAASINTSVTTISIQSADAAKFPSPTGGDWFPITVIDSAGNIEIMKCTARSSATLTVTRAQEGTTAKSFASGARVDLRLTAAAVNQIYNDAKNASNLTSGTLPDARLAGAYSGITTLSQSGLHTITVAGEALRIAGPLATDDPYISFYKAGVREAYIQHRDGTGAEDGIRIANDNTGDFLYLSNVDSSAALKFKDASTGVQNTVWHSGNLSTSDIMAVPTSRNLTAGNGLTGGGQLTADRTFTLGTPSSITNSTTNSVTSTSHTHALGFTAAEVYTGSTADEVNLPIGHPVIVGGGNFSGSTNRNASATIRLYTTGSTDYANHGTGAVLSGTYRSRGGWTQGGERFQLMQRAA
ncbi:hypothetical protein I6F11_04050 [Ensifer sp. NBAIM29]|nr:hypothetical protein [Ensifer sp. NBAIM29]